jgi:hypothetical protein
MKVTDETALFTDALHVMNRALEENREAMPWSQMIKAANLIADRLKIGVAVYADDPATPHDYYTVCFSDGKFELLEHGKSEVKIAWKVPRAFLEKVTENPEEYVNNPAKLDWDWFKERLGIG